MTTTPVTPLASGSMSAVGLGAPFSYPEGLTGAAPVYVTAAGPFVGTVQLQRSLDGGATWAPAGTPSGAPSLNGPGSFAFVAATPPGALYALACTASTSGAIAWRVDEGVLYEQPAPLAQLV